MSLLCRNVFLCLCLALVIESGLCVKFPSSFKRCRVNKELDGKLNPCLKEAVQEAVVKLSAEGNSDLNAIKLDPLVVKNIYLEKGDQSPVAIKLNFTDNSLIGISTARFDTVSGKLSSPKEFVMDMDVHLDTAALVGPYVIAGKVLILPIQGKGQSNITMSDVSLKMSITAGQQIKNGKEYLKLTRLHITIEPQHLYIFLGNLFNGDKALGDNMNHFLNENWELIYPELKGPLENAFGSIFYEYSRRILEKIPFNRIFITE